MYNVLLADDEYLELELLEKHIDWRSLGFRVAASVKNGNEAMRFIENCGIGNMPDVLITDVKMPFVDGIELSKIVHNRYPDVHIIFISGYNSFEYMKSALKVGAMDYLMKPIELGELTALLTVVKAQCDERMSRTSVARAVICDWIQNEFGGVTKTRDYYDKLPEFIAASFGRIETAVDTGTGEDTFEGGQFFFVTLLAINELRYLKDIEGTGGEVFSVSSFRELFSVFADSVGGVLAEVRETKFFLITSTDISDAASEWKLKEREHEELQEFVTVCLYDKPIDTRGICASGLYTKMAQFADTHSYHSGPGHLLSFDEKGEVSASPGETAVSSGEATPAGIDLKSLFDAVANNRESEIHKILTSFFEDDRREDFHNAAMNLLDSLYEFPLMLNSLSSAYTRKRPALFNRLLRIESIVLLKIEFTRYLLALAREYGDALQTDAYQIVIKKVNEYLNTNHGSSFSIDDMARTVCYSPNYLRSVYKKHTGKTVLEALTLTRVRHSELLLRDSKLTIYAISNMVGYQSAAYFCAQFAKIHGMTPQQYRVRGMRHE